MTMPVRRLILTAALLAGASVAARGAAETLPRPGVGVFVTAADLPALREKIRRPPCQEIYEKILKDADASMAKWPADKAAMRLEELAPKLADINSQTVPREFLPDGGKEAGMALMQYADKGAPDAAFVYLMTGDRRYADFAWDVFRLCSKANRWGWFPWEGSHMPQIHFGTTSRNLVLVADSVWDTLSDADRRLAKQTIAEKVVEPYYRLVLHTPGMGLYHLRSLNQGNNALGAAFIGSIFVGDADPDNRIWFASLLQTWYWAVTHDIGWMGQHLESGIGGYWSVSMQNLYTAGTALRNVRGIDLRGHPGFEQATYYPIIHETTVPPVGHFRDPIDAAAAPPVMGIIGAKPLELPGASTFCGPWWFDYAASFPESPAAWFIEKHMIQGDKIRAAECHQGALARVLAMNWWDDRLKSPGRPPTSLAQFTDRMAGVRSGYGFGETYLYFNGDLFLTARKEILGCTSGMSWHFPWHQYQVTESGVETEGETFAPSMIIRRTAADDRFAFFRAESGFSNVACYAQMGQRESHTHYAQRDRSVLYVRPDKTAGTPDYFVFLDDVRHKSGDPKWYAWTWHLWNSTTDPKNFGRFTVAGASAVRAERPNADLWIQFISPDRVAVEQHGIPSQPAVSYVMDHNARMMRAVAGGYDAPADSAKTVTIPPSAWRGMGEAQADALYIETPPTARPADDTPAPTTAVVTGIVGGTRYRWSLRCREQDYRVYEATAWEVSLELLDAKGDCIAKPSQPYGRPDSLKLGAPRSDMLTHDWVETAMYFDAPPGAVACRASFRAVGGAHYFKLGKLWLSPIQIVPVGRPHRAEAQRFITLVMPLEKGAPPPKVSSGQGGFTVEHPGGTTDAVTVSADGEIALARTRGGQTVAKFPSAAADTASTMSLKTNSDASAARLAAGFKPVLDALSAERDALTKAGRRNLADDAKVAASAVRDERFAAAHVIDNQTAEYAADGRLDYTLGITWSSNRTAGYGTGKESLLANRECFPLYIRPTYWLLPEETPGWIELELKAPAAVRLVRLLNTSNAGLNDFAAHTFRVELFDRSHKLLAAKDGAFGKVFDRPFRQAFFEPKWFSRYAETFAGMLEPGVTVPFGDGWKEIALDAVKDAAFVRVTITKYWGIGGGLNEIQVYGD